MSFKDNIRSVEPYVPGEQPEGSDIIKLNTNENPYSPSPKVTAVLRDFNADTLRKYPDPESTILVDAISDKYGISQDRIFVGVGSDDVLAMSFLTFFNSKKPILFADITYSFYPVWCDLFRIPFETVALDDEFYIDKEGFTRENGGIVIANPNAPTGIALGIDEIEYIVSHNPESVCIIDEAYIDFGGVSAVWLLDKYENLLVVRTFSKSYSLCGSRVGYAFGSRVLIEALQAAKFSFNSYTMNAISLKVGAAAVSDWRYFDDVIEKVKGTRETTRQRLIEMGFSVLPSDTNFLFITHPIYRADELFAMLKEKKIYVRYFRQPRIDNYLRVTIGTDEEMDAFVLALKEYMGEGR